MVKTSSNDRDKNKPLIRFSWWAVSYLQIMIETIPANISYSKSTIEKLVKSVKYDVIDVALVFLLLTLNIFHTLF